MLNTIGAIPHNTIITKRHQAISLYPVGNRDQQQINAMKLGLRRNARRQITKSPQYLRAS